MTAVAQAPFRPDAAAGDAASRSALKGLHDRMGRSKDKAVLGKLKAALTAIKAQDYAAATEAAMAALQIDERHPIAWHILAIAREKAGDLEPALKAYDAALRLAPDETTIAHDLGRLAQRLGYLEIAEKLLLKCIAARPDHVDALNNLACVMRDGGRYDEAIGLLQATLQAQSESAVLWNTLGTVLTDRGDMAGSLVFFDEALRLRPDFSKALYNRANARLALGQAAQAMADLDEALTGALDAHEVAAMNMARALTQMRLGRLAEGFATYEARFDRTQKDALGFVTPSARWTPAMALEGRRLLVFGEQGLGDEVLFASALPDVISAVGPDGHVTIAVETRLVPLFARSFPSATVVRHMTQRRAGRLFRIAALDEATPTPELHAPIASLFGALRPSADAFPDRPAFLTPDPARVADFREQLKALGEGRKVGVVWKSLKLDGSRARYFSPFDLWRPVLETPGVRFVNLQYGDCDAELAQARAAGIDLWTPPGLDLKDDLEGVAALACALDLIIGPMNATSNIAAACGAPVWMILSPDAWTSFGQETMPTYPRVRPFPIDGFGQWEGVMARLAEALRGD